MTQPARPFLHEALFRGDKYTRIQDKVPVIAGCGAIGSWTATLLARMGVQAFRLIDRDKVEQHNISTQTFTPANIGQHKTRALQEQLYRITKARCELHPVELSSRNTSLLHNADLVICSFDNRPSRMLVKTVCLEKSIPCLFAGMNGAENYFEVVWTEQYKVPNDPVDAELDPCDYPLSTPLVMSAAAATAEIAMQFLTLDAKRSCRQTLNQTISPLFG